MKETKNYFKILFIAIFLCLFYANHIVYAQSVEEQQFFVESGFDVSARSKIDAVSVKTSQNLYFYIEKNWWDSQHELKKQKILKNLEDLSIEFQDNIYPKLTSVFGFERKPGIDNDNKITVLFHPIKTGEVGYFRTNDGYEKLQISNSNQREMVYISVDILDTLHLKSVLAHEFVHLITFNQKNLNFRVEEDVWLNEARADYSSIILGYDKQTNISNVQSRIKDFIESPSDSITEWRSTKYDYASVFLFSNYLVDHYGVKILSDSLKSKYSGIESINYALEKDGYKEKFSEIFTNWTIALVLNDCSLDKKYCYLNENFKNIRISPNINFLPIFNNAFLSFINTQKNWSGNWQKFIGGNGDLRMEIFVKNDLKFSVPYIIEDKQAKQTVKFLTFNNNGETSINIPEFSNYYKSLIIIPTLQDNIMGVVGSDTAQNISYNVYAGTSLNKQNPLSVSQLLIENEELKKKIDSLQKKLATYENQNISCKEIKNNLFYGMTNNDVRCLQEFLKSQGTDVYPEGLVTGYFGLLTKNAVIRFQEKYFSDILSPIGLKKGTGYVGNKTRDKINQISK